MRAFALLRRLVRRPLPLEVWYDEAYRLPLPSLEESAGMETRRVDFVAWCLLDHGAIAPSQQHTPSLAHWEDLQRVHRVEWLESLQSAKTLAQVFAVDPSEVPVEDLLRFIRLATGGTVAAAAHVLRQGGVALNLAGGFHHAGRAKGGGFCAVNDIAVALARARAEGFVGQAVVLDLDAHPPDGTAECLAEDDLAWVGSLSGSRWEQLGPMEEIVLPEGTGDEQYLLALEALLGRMPVPKLAFVLAGGDVLQGDRLGKLGLTLQGVRRRDARVARAMRGVPQVWLPGGGYHKDSWRVLAGTGLVLAGRPGCEIRPGYDPLTSRFFQVSGKLDPDALQGELQLTEADVFGDLNRGPSRAPRLLGYYTPSGLEYGLYQMGILGQVGRLGYQRLRVEVDQEGTGDRFRLFGTAEGKEYLLVEAILCRRRVGGMDVLFVNWLTLRNPRARFAPERPPLPGQEVPGLGLAREATLLLGLLARRLSLVAVALRPTWYHLAYAGRDRFRFLDPERHGRFLALVRDTAGLPLLEVSKAVAEGRVRLNGEPYLWEATELVHWLGSPPEDPDWTGRMEAEKERSTFELLPATSG